jgi:hypothetical protein
MFVETSGRGEWHGRETGHNKGPNSLRALRRGVEFFRVWMSDSDLNIT